MGRNPLVQALKEADAAKGKKSQGYFDNNASVISYSTGIPVLDYYLGYKVNVFDHDGNFVEDYPSIGITAGSYVLFIGKPGTAKTSTAVKIAANIVRPFESGFVMHFDIEEAMNYSRIQALTRFTMPEMRDGKYILRQEKCTLDDMKSAIIQIHREKTTHREKYTYDTGKKNEFGENIMMLEPTVVILDSIATITVGLEDGSTKSLEKFEEVSSQMDRMRLTAEIGRFLNELLPILREANITLIAINQIKTNPNAGSIIKKPALVQGLNLDEALPGGLSQIFNAQIFLKFIAVSGGVHKSEEDGFDGFDLKMKVIKSRVSAALKETTLVYDKNTGISMVRSTVEYLKGFGLVGGNRAGYYFADIKDHKFTLANMERDFANDPELFHIMKKYSIPLLEKNLSGIVPEELIIPDGEMNFYNL